MVMKLVPCCATVQKNTVHVQNAHVWLYMWQKYYMLHKRHFGLCGCTVQPVHVVTTKCTQGTCTHSGRADVWCSWQGHLCRWASSPEGRCCVHWLAAYATLHAAPSAGAHRLPPAACGLSCAAAPMLCRTPSKSASWPRSASCDRWKCWSGRRQALALRT